MATEQTAFTAQFREQAAAAGADMVGIAAIESFAELGPAKNPASIFPETKSVIVIGKRITRGALRGTEEGTQFELYRMYGRDWLNNRFLAMATFSAAEFLEDNGWEAVPLPNLPPEIPPMGVPVSDGRPAPNVMLDFDGAAVRAGLGEMGRCGLLLTPEFGPRQRLQIILTDAPLEADPPFTGKVCLRCADLENVCPLGALGADGGIDYALCARCHNGAEPNPFHPSGKPDRFAALCTRTCIDRLEAAGVLQNKFCNRFRTRKPWGVVEERRRL